MIALWLASAWAAAPPPMINGEVTTDYAPVGAFSLYYGGRDQVFCSGTLIEPGWMLTAAHCAAEGQPLIDQGASVDVLFGGAVKSGDIDERVEVVEFYSHPDYNAALLTNDFALARLATDLDRETYPLTSESPSRSWIGTEDIRLVGFGVTDGLTYEGEGTKRTISLPVIELDGYFVYGYDGGDHNVCFGDSGGAALREVDGGYEVLGPISFTFIISGSDPCGDDAGTGVARIDTAVDWVNEVLSGDYEVGSGSGNDGGSYGTGTGATSAFSPDDETGCESSTRPGRPLSLAGLLALLALYRRRESVARG